MISESQLMALSQHLTELQAELNAVAPLFQSLTDKVQVLNDVVDVMRSDFTQGIEDDVFEQSASVGFPD